MGTNLIYHCTTPQAPILEWSSLREEDQMSPGRFHLESKMKTWIWLVQVTAIYLQFSEEDANAQNYKTEQEDTESNRV